MSRMCQGGDHFMKLLTGKAGKECILGDKQRQLGLLKERSKKLLVEIEGLKTFTDTWIEAYK